MSGIGIDFTLRANSSGFTKAVASAENSIKGIKKGLKEFDVGNGFKQALGVGGVIEGFRVAITNAQELRDEADKIGKSLDAGTRSVAEFGDSLGKIGTGFKNVLTDGLSFFTGLGDSARRFMQGVTKDQEDAARTMAAQTVKAADEAEARLKKSREDNSPEKKKAAHDDLAKAERQSTYQGAEANKKLLELINEQADIKEKMRGMGKETVAYTKLETDLEKNKLAMKEAALQLDKEAKDKAKTDADKAKKDAEEANKKKKDLAGKFGPSVEDLAKTELGGFFDGNDPRLKARAVMAKEEAARAAYGRGDYKGGMASATEAQSMREALENQMAGIKSNPAKDQPTAKQMDELIKAVSGIIKASP